MSIPGRDGPLDRPERALHKRPFAGHEPLSLTGGLLPAERTAINRLKRSRQGLINGCNNRRQIVFEDVPFDSGQYHDGKIAPLKILLVQNRLIAG